MPAIPKTTIQSSVTKSAAFTPSGNGIDISGLSSDATLHLTVASLTPAGSGGVANAMLVFYDSVDNFTTSKVVASENVHANGQKWQKSWRIYRELPSFRLGISGATCKLALIDLTTGAAINYTAWID